LGSRKSTFWGAESSEVMEMWVIAPILALPLIEIALFVTIGAWLGLWVTLAIVMGTAILGVQVLRQQGLGAMQEFQRGGQTADTLSPLAHGALKTMAGLMLILPGFLTDTLGLLLLIPQVRNLAIATLASRIRFTTFTTNGGRPTPQGDWIDGDYEVVPPERDKLTGGSKWSGH
jgi:UPF0716 protein FxsA